MFLTRRSIAVGLNVLQFTSQLPLRKIALECRMTRETQSLTREGIESTSPMAKGPVLTSVL